MGAEFGEVPLRDWIKSAGISRTTAYQLIGFLGIRPVQRRVVGINKPIAHLTSEQQESLEPLVHDYLRGVTIPMFRARYEGKISTPAQPGPPTASVPEPSVRFTVDLTKTQHLQLRLASVETGLPMTDLVRTAIAVWLDQREKPQVAA